MISQKVVCRNEVAHKTVDYFHLVDDPILVDKSHWCSKNAQGVLENERDKAPNGQQDHKRDNSPHHECLSLLSLRRIIRIRDEFHNSPKEHYNSDQPEQIIQPIENIQKHSLEIKDRRDRLSGCLLRKK